MARVGIVLGALLLLLLGGPTVLTMGAIGVPDEFARHHHVMMLSAGIIAATVGALALWLSTHGLD